MSFPLEQWFDTRKKISKADRIEARDEIQWRTIKDGMSLHHPSCIKACKELRLAVAEHNRNFESLQAKNQPE